MTVDWHRFGARTVLGYRLLRRAVGLPHPCELRYVVPKANWSNDWDGRYITNEVRRQFGLLARVADQAWDAAGDIVHYGSLWTFLENIGQRHNERNLVVATVFHGNRSPRYPELARAMDLFLDHIEEAQAVVVSCHIMEERLRRWGVSPEVIYCIPLGVDLSLFRSVSAEEKRACRRALGIPDDAICIGSFQKDGNGWGEGLTPKLIKGPDAFLEVIARLNEQYPIFVLLTGPARGYVRKGLEGLGIPYRHEWLRDLSELAAWYWCLDLYVVSSREEGGPKAVLESLASGVPLVSTRVGMVPDVIIDGRNGLLAGVDEVDTLVEHAASVIDRPELRDRLVARGLTTVADYGWEEISARYYREVYEPLLQSLCR